MELIKLLILNLVLIACGANIDPAKEVEIESVVSLQDGQLTGTFQDLDGNSISLENFSKSSIVIFASETCSVCRKEGALLASTFRAQGQSKPSNVDFYTIMIGAYYDGDSTELPVEIATEFASDLGINWTMGYNRNDEIFNRLCPEGVTPCIVTYRALDRRTFRFIGETEFSKLQEATETWTY